MRVLAFAASNNKQSINRIFASYTANLIKAANVETLDIHDYEMPIFSDDREKELGQPEQAKKYEPESNPILLVHAHITNWHIVQHANLTGYRHEKYLSPLMTL